VICLNGARRLRRRFRRKTSGYLIGMWCLMVRFGLGNTSDGWDVDMGKRLGS
jgi:hypothetical protein